MCGISGIFAKTIKDDHVQLLNAIVESQFSRGPDHQDTLIIRGKKNQIILGHNRLSVIDLSQDANQPMWDAAHRYCIVYNGEIYNYIELRQELQNKGFVFRTASDTEVILNSFACWGIDSLNRFVGPFAFTLYDADLEEVWLCRDRFGVKPLFYTQAHHTLYLASSSSVLARQLDLKADLSYIAKGLNYLVYEDDSEKTAYQNLKHVPAGCYLHASFKENDALSCKIIRYYDLAFNVENTISNLFNKKPSDLVEDIHHRLEKAVQIRLRTDVPLAISLSGGLDSSSVAALVKKHYHNTVGFSFSHPDEKKSEGSVVSRCAAYLNIHVEYVWPSQHDMIQALYKTIKAQDAPFSTLSIVAQYMLYEKVRASGIKVLLGGQGGDEAFMGYKKFMLFWIQQNMKQKQFVTTAKTLVQTLPMILSELGSLKAYWNHRNRYTNMNHTSSRVLNLPDHPDLSLNHHSEKLWKRQMMDITAFSLPTLLRYEDRNAMGNSVESRLPYMDHQLIELGLALPETIKLRSGYGKWVIRKIMQNKIPDEIRLARYKRGFDIPLKPLINAGLGQSIRTLLHDNERNIKDYLKDSKKITDDFSDYQLINRKNAIAEAITLLWLSKECV